MTDYLDHDNKKLEKGFYQTIFIAGLPVEGGQQGGDILYFTGKFNKKGDPIIIYSRDYNYNSKKETLTNYNLKERSASKAEFNRLERVNVNNIKEKVESLELKLNWFKGTLSRFSQEDN